MKSYREERTCKTKPRKFKGYCEECKKEICSCKAYSYIDGNNAAVTNSSPYLCKECYERKYNVHIADDVERFKNKLIEALQRVQYNSKLETLRIDKLIEFIRSSD